MSDGPTPYTEANAILYAQQGDQVALSVCLGDMLPNELRDLGDAAYKLGDLCRQYEMSKRRDRAREELERRGKR